MSTEKLLGYTKNNIAVYFDRDSGHAATHLTKHLNLEATVKNYLDKIDATDEIVRCDFDTETNIGKTDLVETDENDDIIYALRAGRSTYSRFCKNKPPQLTSWITIDVRRRPDGNYSLYTAFIGRQTPSFPGGDIMAEQSVQFWARHALAWGSQEIVLGTETLVCPW
jgi:hypothetical protein